MRLCGVEMPGAAREPSYIDLVRCTELQVHPETRGELSASAQTPLEGLWSVANHPREWMQRVQGTQSRYYRAIGSAETLMLKAADLGQQWMKGVSGEFALMKLAEYRQTATMRRWR